MFLAPSSTGQTADFHIARPSAPSHITNNCVSPQPIPTPVFSSATATALHPVSSFGSFIQSFHPFSSSGVQYRTGFCIEPHTPADVCPSLRCFTSDASHTRIPPADSSKRQFLPSPPARSVTTSLKTNSACLVLLRRLHLHVRRPHRSPSPNPVAHHRSTCRPVMATAESSHPNPLPFHATSEAIRGRLPSVTATYKDPMEEQYRLSVRRKRLIMGQQGRGSGLKSIG